jgi:hypothetical protein
MSKKSNIVCRSQLHTPWISVLESFEEYCDVVYGHVMENLVSNLGGS